MSVKMLHMSPRMIASLLCIVILGCGRTTSKTVPPGHFASPAIAVEQISVMLENKNWPKLAKYYDLTDATIDLADLTSGDFFYTEERPVAAHPAGFWKYKHPFAPPFKFKSTRDLEEPGVIEVTVGVEIDQGGGLIQRGMQTFLLRKTEKGYQVMPRKSPGF